MTTTGKDFPILPQTSTILKCHSWKVVEEEGGYLKRTWSPIRENNSTRSTLTNNFWLLWRYMNPQDRFFNIFHRNHNSFQTLNRILEAKDLIWFLGVLNTLWCLQGDLYLMAQALLKCIWFTETEFVFNKKQTFKEIISSEIASNSVDGSTLIFLITAL